MRKTLVLIAIIMIASTSFGCIKQSGQESKSLIICAAASLKDALNEIKPLFEQDTGIFLTFNFGSSGALQKQIEEGAPADVFISAGKKQMDELESKGLIDDKSRRNILGNQLVLIVPKENQDQIEDISQLANKDVRISIGEPTSVPAGQYAKEAQEYLKLWDVLRKKCVLAKDVKQVTAYVEKGEVAAGIVYHSDAAALKNSVIVQTFDTQWHQPIVYPGASIHSSKEKEAAELLLDYLNTQKAKEIFHKYGFDTNVK